MKRNFFILICLFTFSLTSFCQNPDSITIIPLASSKSDSVKPVKQAVGAPRARRPDSFWRRISLGGNLGFQFGTVTGFNISPEARIRTVDQLYVGVGFIYQYFRFKDSFYDTVNLDYVSYTSNTFGGKIYLRYYLRSLFEGWAGNFFVHTEYEYLHFVIPFEYDPNGRFVDIYNPVQRYSEGREVLDVHSVFIGGGYSQPISNRVFIDLLVLFNLNDSPASPYTNPVFRLGVGVGL
ncbi:MAG: hypothetical protein IH596_05790 [Bacteroidales bacterium]|nr:hypothetical protein [Bacteroidales bacterium]